MRDRAAADEHGSDPHQDHTPAGRQPGTPIRVAVVEDDAGTLANLREVVESDPQCRWVGGYRTVAQAVAGLPESAPRVVVVDVHLPDGTGVDCVARLAPRMPDTEFVMLTVFKDGDVLFDALAAGAHGYLIKPVRAEELLLAIRDVSSGGTPLSSVIARRIVRFFERSATVEPPADAPPPEALSAREREVLELLAAGALYKQVASKLKVSPNTIRSHIRRIYKKLHVSSRQMAVERYLRLR